MSLKKIISLFLVLTIAAAALVLPAAAASKDATAKAGMTGTLEFTVEGVYGIDGSYSFINEEIVESVQVIYVTNLKGDSNTETQKFVYHNGTQTENFTVKFEVTLKDNVTAGDAFTVELKYRTSDIDGNVSQWITETAKLVVAQTEPGPSGSTGTTPTDPKPTDPKPTEPAAMDYTELNKQIGIAEGLQKADYTSASWANLETALEAAYKLRDSKDQAAVDAGAKALSDAIASLVLMDYSKLLEAIELVEELFGENELGQKWAELYQKMLDAKELLTSGDQAAVDAAAAELSKLYQEMKDLIKEYLENNKEVVEVEKEVIVEVYPEGDHCNISIHKLWPILFIISAALNVGFLVVIIVYIARKKKNQKDETPLVDYDIDDDKL